MSNEGIEMITPPAAPAGQRRRVECCVRSDDAAAFVASPGLSLRDHAPDEHHIDNFLALLISLASSAALFIISLRWPSTISSRRYEHSEISL